jgi:hypothetical protein
MSFLHSFSNQERKSRDHANESHLSGIHNCIDRSESDLGVELSNEMVVGQAVGRMMGFYEFTTNVSANIPFFSRISSKGFERGWRHRF